MNLFAREFHGGGGWLEMDGWMDGREEKGSLSLSLAYVHDAQM